MCASVCVCVSDKDIERVYLKRNCLKHPIEGMETRCNINLVENDRVNCVKCKLDEMLNNFIMFYELDFVCAECLFPPFFVTFQLVCCSKIYGQQFIVVGNFTLNLLNTMKIHFNKLNRKKSATENPKVVSLQCWPFCLCVCFLCV